MLAPIFHVDVFSARPYGGNPAAAVLLENEISDEAMLAVAQEIRMPGTSFSWRAEEGFGARHVRFFTPGREVALSGHTAIGCAHAVHDAGLADEETVRLITRTESLEIVKNELRQWLALPDPSTEPFGGPIEQILESVGLSSNELDSRTEPVLSSDGDLFLHLASEVDIEQLGPEMKRLAEVASGAGIRVVCVSSTRTHDPEEDFRIRVFAPHYGLPEDIATGSVRGAFAKNLLEAGILDAAEGTRVLRTEQGRNLGRPSIVEVEITINGGRLEIVRVGGSAVTVSRGSILLPENL